MIKLEDKINFHGPEWKNLKLWLEAKQLQKTEMLISSKDHDNSNQLRGAITFIKELLAQEKAASMAAHVGHN
jgi:hypothetical protein